MKKVFAYIFTAIKNHPFFTILLCVFVYIYFSRFIKDVKAGDKSTLWIFLAVIVFLLSLTIIILLARLLYFKISKSSLSSAIKNSLFLQQIDALNQKQNFKQIENITLPYYCNSKREYDNIHPNTVIAMSIKNNLNHYADLISAIDDNRKDYRDYEAEYQRINQNYLETTKKEKRISKIRTV